MVNNFNFVMFLFLQGQPYELVTELTFLLLPTSIESIGRGQ